MNKVAMVVGLAVCAAACSANEIWFWFSTESNAQAAATTGPINLNIGTSGPTSTRAYLYAVTPGHWATMYDENEGQYFTGWEGDLWEGLGMDLYFTHGGSLGADNKVWNLAAAGMPRWGRNADLEWTPINPFGIYERGCGGANNFYNNGEGGVFDNRQYCEAAHVPGTSGTVTTQLGFVEFRGDVGAEMYLVVSIAGIARRNGDEVTDTVRFGVGDAALPDDAFGEHSAVYDARYVPEPGSLVLLAIAACFLRRR
jgi:hypothetical protein